MWPGLVAPLKHLKLIYIKIVKQHAGKWAWQCRNAADFCCLTGKNVNKRDLRKEVWQGSLGGGCRVAGSICIYSIYFFMRSRRCAKICCSAGSYDAFGRGVPLIVLCIVVYPLKSVSLNPLFSSTKCG